MDYIIYTLPNEPCPVSFLEMFGNDQPVEVEIGCGKGRFLLEQARAHQDRNYVGIEWANKYFRFAADRMARWGLANVRIIRTDAKLFITRYAPPDSLAALHIHHPDPWPKKRHHKRRLIDPAFVEAVGRVLQDGAACSIQTDSADYFEVIEKLFADRAEFQSSVRVIQSGQTGDGLVPTNYQVKYQRDGRTFYRLVFIRVPRSSQPSALGS